MMRRTSQAKVSREAGAGAQRGARARQQEPDAGSFAAQALRFLLRAVRSHWGVECWGARAEAGRVKGCYEGATRQRPRAQ